MESLNFSLDKHTCTSLGDTLQRPSTRSRTCSHVSVCAHYSDYDHYDVYYHGGLLSLRWLCFPQTFLSICCELASFARHCKGSRREWRGGGGEGVVEESQQRWLVTFATTRFPLTGNLFACWLRLLLLSKKSNPHQRRTHSHTLSPLPPPPRPLSLFLYLAILFISIFMCRTRRRRHAFILLRISLLSPHSHSHSHAHTCSCVYI